MKIHSVIIKPLGEHEEQARYQWLCLDNRKRPIGSVQQGTLNDVRQHLSGCSATLLLDAIDVVESRIEVPVKQHKQLPRILPFEIEPGLACDISQLHIAGRVVSGEEVAVAHVERAVIAESIAELESAGLEVEHCFSEGHLYNTDSMNWVLDLSPATGSLNCAWGEGRYYTVKKSQAAWLLQLLLKEQVTPETVTVLAETDESADSLAADIKKHLPESVRVVRQVGKLVSWQWLSTDYTGHGVELRQGEFQAPVRWGKKIGWLKLPAVAATLALTSYLAATALATYQSNRQFEALQVAIEENYRQAMPQGMLVDAAQQLRSQLAQLDGDNGGVSLLWILEQIAPALTGVPGVRVQRLTYNAARQELNLSISAMSNDDMLALNDALTEAGLNARTQNISRRNESYLAQFVIFAPEVTS